MRKAFEYYVLQNIDGYPFKQKDLHQIYHEAIIKTERRYALLPHEINSLSTNGLAAFKKLMIKLDFKPYVPIYTNLEENIKINKTAIRCSISSLAVTQQGHLRGWVFSPFDNLRDIKSDIIHKLQYEILSNYHLDNTSVIKRFTPVLYIIYEKEGVYNITYSERRITKIDRTKLLIDENRMLNNFHYPLAPCLFFTCPYRKDCPSWD